MEDNQIIDLYWKRSDAAIVETSSKYSKYCHYISNNILRNTQDAEECVNDTFLQAWNAIPPNRPDRLSAFLAKITRNLSFNKYKSYSAKKRGGSQAELALAELEECIPSSENVEQVIDNISLADTINHFLASLPQTNRMVFMRRYWYLSSIKEIGCEFNMKENKVKSILFRERKKLKTLFEKEGIIL